MATVKIKFRASSVGMKEGTLFFQVIHKRVARQVSTGLKLYPHEWDAAHGGVVLPPDADDVRRAYLVALEERAVRGVDGLRNIVMRLERCGRDYTADRVVEMFLQPSASDRFLSFGRRLVRELRSVGRERTAETYTTALNSFERFRRGDDDVYLDEVDSSLITAYETWLKASGICPNSTSYYMRNLRAVYNRAVDKELTAQRHPFKHVYTGIDKTVKRAVPVRVIRQIREMDLSFNPSMDFARDIFMFSFYTRGMSFIDMAYLKKKNLQNGILSYRRQKTGQQLFVKWEKPMQEIIDKYDTSSSPYLLPVIKNNGKDAWRQYKNAEHLVNNKLKKIGMLLKLSIPLTTYVARHGWASIAKSKNIPITTISEAMGPDSEGPTRIYLASLDASVVDRANSLILRSI